MVRFVPFIVALVIIGVTAGNPPPSTVDGKLTLLPPPEEAVDFRLIVKPSWAYLAYVL